MKDYILDEDGFINCENFEEKDYPNLRNDMYVECYNGCQGRVTSVFVGGNHFSIPTYDKLHKLDIKRITFINKKYLLTSEDGVLMFEGDIFWYTMNLDTVKGCRKPTKGFKYYSSRAEAEKHIIKKTRNSFTIEETISLCRKAATYCHSDSIITKSDLERWLSEE